MKKQTFLQYFCQLLLAGGMYSSQAHALLEIGVSAQTPAIDYQGSDTTAEKSFYARAQASTALGGIGDTYFDPGGSWPVCSPADPLGCAIGTIEGESEASARGEINADLGRFRGRTSAYTTLNGSASYASVAMFLDDEMKFYPGQQTAFDFHIDLSNGIIPPGAVGGTAYNDHQAINDYSISVCLIEGNSEGCGFDPIAGFEYSNFGLSTKLRNADGVFTPIENLDQPFEYHWDVTDAVPLDIPVNLYIQVSLKSFCFNAYCATDLDFSNTAYIGIQGNYESSNGYMFPYTVPTTVPLPMTWVMFLSGLGFFRFIPKGNR